jgi:uncharacterized protein YebE (UPF0316 family)
LEITVEALLFAGFLFTLRVMNYSVSTIRLVFIARNRRGFAALLAFFEALIFAIVTANVVTDLTNIINLLAYCLGASFGSYTGMLLETRLFTSYSTITIITHERGKEVATALRQAGFGATVTTGEGRDGQVTMIRSSALNRDVQKLLDVVRTVQPEAFIEVEAARALIRGWIPGNPNGSRV